MNTELLLLLMILPPFVGSALSWIVDKLWYQSSRILGLFSIGLSSLTSMYSFFLIISNNWGLFEWQSSKYIYNGDNEITIALAPDSLSIFMAVIASFLGLLIAIFSIEYMAKDENITRYWFFLQLFIGGMILLVLAGDFILMYVGWEIVGLCSFGLISHWYTKEGEEGIKCGLAGIKAFVFTRIGDIGFLIGVVLVYHETGTTVFSEIDADISISSKMTTFIGLLFLLAAFGKSAQFPFIPWLSSPDDVDIDAMQGPTTVSALIHAATMVKAGVYLIARLYLVLPLWKSDVFVWSLVIFSSITALIAALSALVSYDLKRILAYSTVSQLAYMFMSLGLAYSLFSTNEHISKTAFLAAQFHLISHALFKSLLFLTAGYIIHSYKSRDLRELNGVASWDSNRFAFIGILTGGFALAGIPPLNGFWSKESIISTAFEGSKDGGGGKSLFVYIIAVTTALITAIYVARLLYYLIRPVKISRTEEGSSLMKIVIIGLSFLVLLGGLLAIEIPDYFDDIVVNGELPSISSELLLIFLLTLSILLLMWITYISLVSNRGTIIAVSNIFIVAHIVKLSKNGFYLDAMWMNLWNGFKVIVFELRKLHTGKLNYAILESVAVSLGILVYMIGG